MNCDCIERINKKLKDAGHNYQVAPSLVFDEKMQLDSLLSVATTWVGEPPRGKKHKFPPVMLCTYCPFCRKKAAGNKK